MRGKSAEQRAASLLRKNGLKILAQNVRYKCGELDIIASDDETHLFVEVKYRANEDWGKPTEMVSPSKQAKLAKAAKLWLQENDPNFEKSCRFDVIAMTAAENTSTVKNKKSRKPSENIQWVKNAFTPELW